MSKEPDEVERSQNRVLYLILAAVLGVGGTGFVKTQPADVKDEVLQVREIVQRNKETVDNLWESHNRFDSDGVYMWYIPRSWGRTQEEVLQTTRLMLETQRETNRLLTDIAEGLKK